MDLFGKTPSDYALECLKAFEPPEGYYLAFSGGKDSVCLYDLAVRAGVKFDAHYSHTGIDPPELTRFIRKEYPQVHWERPKRSFQAGIMSHGLPTRRARWCCQELKELHGNRRSVLVGVRAAESSSRARRYKQVTFYRNRGIEKTLISPILNWSDGDVWRYIAERQLPYCRLYDEGFRRIGCIPCPMAGRSLRANLARYPGTMRATRKAADAYLARRKADGARGLVNLTDDEYWEWWLSGTAADKDSSQQCLVYV